MQFAFEGIEGAEVIYDDLLVWGKDEECHDKALRNVLERASEKGVKLKKQKCEIKIPEVVYIGDKITKDGIKPDESKIEAILNLPSPQNKKDVERLLGMVTYLSKFIPISEQKLKEFQEATKADQSLQTVAQLTKQGWPDHKNKVPADAKPYWSFKEEIHEADGILFKSHKMIVPERLRPEMLKRIHESHLGIEKSKRRAHDILYWPNMNAQITDVIANCSSCLKHRKNNTKEPLIQHEVPDRPWQKIVCDLFTLGGKDYLLTVDYYSKWVEIGLLRDSTVSSEVITQLKSTFAHYRIPDEVISDNGPQFSSRKFKQFADSWEFKHTTTSPKHPQANGQVEKAVGTAKSVLKKAYRTNPYIALLENRNTPITGLSYSPAQIFLNRRLKTKLPTATQLLNARIPTDAKSQLLAQQKSQKLYFDRGAKSLPPVTTGDTVQMKTEWLETCHGYKTCSHPSISNCEQQWNSLQTKQERHHQDTGSHKSER